MLDLTPLITKIRDGGDPDIYRGVNGLICVFPVPDWLGDTFMAIAHTIAWLYPERVDCAIVHQYDARVVCLDFCNDPRTDRDDVLRVLRRTIVRRPAETRV